LRWSGKRWVGFSAALIATGLLALGWWVTRRVEGSTFDSAGVPIHFTDEGSGVPVILLHGFAVNADLNWRLPGLTDELSQEYRVVSMDLRGHGLSGKPTVPEAYGEAMAEDVIRLLDHLEIERAHVVGYSLGGIITLKLASTHPERLLSAAPLAAGWEDPEDSVFLLAIDGIADDLAAGHGVAPLAASLGGEREPPGALHTAWVRFLTRYLSDGPALAAMLRAIGELTVERADVLAIAVPVCSVVGTLDAMKPGVDAMVGVVPDHTVVYVEGADHLSATLRPELIAALRACLADAGGSERQ
jgi:pimeloyl-ACP methyl ester carboxylesterase